MAIQTVITLGGLAAGNVALLAASQTPVSGTPLTLTGTQPDKTRRILLTYGSEGSARTLVLAGTNHTGNVIGETLAVPSGGSGTVQSALDYKTLTSATPAGGGWTAAVTLGTNGVASSTWRVVDKEFGPTQISFGCVVSGTINYTIQYTYDDPNNTLGNSAVPPTTWTVPGLGAQTATADGVINGGPVYAWRVLLNSGTGTVVVTSIQAGIRN